MAGRPVYPHKRTWPTCPYDTLERGTKQMNSKLLKGASWQGYAVAVTDDQARAAFIKRYGRPPARVIRSKGSVLAGPLTVQEANRE